LRLQNLILELIDKGLVNSAHDVSDGGLLVAVLECCFAPNQIWGAILNFEFPQSPSSVYFGEAGGRILISAEGENCRLLNKTAQKYNIEFKDLGFVSNEQSLIVNKHITEKLEILYSAWRQGLKI